MRGDGSLIRPKMVGAYLDPDTNTVVVPSDALSLDGGDGIVGGKNSTRYPEHI